LRTGKKARKEMSTEEAIRVKKRHCGGGNFERQREGGIDELGSKKKGK